MTNPRRKYEIKIQPGPCILSIKPTKPPHSVVFLSVTLSIDLIKLIMLR